MRPFWKDFLTALFMGMILPGLMLNAAAYFSPARAEQLPVEVTVETQFEPVPLPVRILDSSGKITEGDLDSYLVGVVLAEMPASFEPEALKAQAVAARTYARKAWDTGGKHGDGSVCTDSGCCQAYISQEDYIAQGGKAADLEKIVTAVQSTSGEVLTYQGELIEATYFSCSGGSTEDAAAVWGTEFPYLQAVESPGEEAAAYFQDTVTFTPEQFQRALGVNLSGYPGSWFGGVTYTEGGGVSTMTIGENQYTGTELRTLLKLRSTKFTVRTGANITITTQGYGHRVGMSQYGADAMAVSGSTYEEILAHYYPGTELTKLC